jgi:hypothetical protein
MLKFRTYKPYNYFDNKNFYKKYPQLAPRNVYLSEGRLLSLKEVEKGLKSIDYTFSEKCLKFLNKIKQIFTKNKS